MFAKLGADLGKSGRRVKWVRDGRFRVEWRMRDEGRRRGQIEGRDGGDPLEQG